MVMKALCLILITVKLTRMFAKKSNLIERTVSKVTLPYYNNEMSSGGSQAIGRDH
jgi:hypothetical protein